MRYILICPECGEENLLTSGECQKCHASLDGVPPSALAEDSISEDATLKQSPDMDGDLPGLFQALKHEEAELPDSGEDLQASPGDLHDLFADGSEDKDLEEEKVPDWLIRIRQRASEEPDAKGDVTQKIAAAIKKITEDPSKNRNEEFQSWIENIRKKDSIEKVEPPVSEKMLEETQEENPQGDEDWLTRIRKAEGKIPEISEEETLGEEIKSTDDKKGDSLLQWLVALEDGEVEPSKEQEKTLGLSGVLSDGEEVAEHDNNDLDTEITQEISLVDSEAYLIDKPVLDIDREEQLQADQLAATIIDEKAPRPPLERVKRSSNWILRVVISLVIIISVVGSIFVGNGWPLGTNRLPQNEAVLSWAVGLPEESSVLLIIDYSPGFASEMTLVAEPILRILAAKNCELSIISSRLSGGILGQSLVEKAAPGESLALIDLGFVPLGSFGGFSIANQLNGGTSVPYLPDTFFMELPEEFTGILILSDQAEGAKGWLEQISALLPNVPIFLLLTAQAGPMSVPYWESGQVSGMISGVAQAANLVPIFLDAPLISAQYRAYQIGILLMIGFILLGAVFSSKHQDDHQEKGGL